VHGDRIKGGQCVTRLQLTLALRALTLYCDCGVSFSFSLLNDGVSQDRWQRMLNWKGSGKERSWPVAVTALAFTEDIRCAGGDFNCTPAVKWRSGALPKSAASF
jgi:hypothetical protein